MVTMPHYRASPTVVRWATSHDAKDFGRAGTRVVTLTQRCRSAGRQPARLPPSLGVVVCEGGVGVEGLGDFEEVEGLRAGIREWLRRTARSNGHELSGIPASAVLPLLCAAAFGPELADAANVTTPSREGLGGSSPRAMPPQGGLGGSSPRAMPPQGGLGGSAPRAMPPRGG